MAKRRYRFGHAYYQHWHLVAHQGNNTYWKWIRNG
jgi:hypothetical protein